jgi:hypothetical protein
MLLYRPHLEFASSVHSYLTKSMCQAILYTTVKFFLTHPACHTIKARDQKRGRWAMNMEMNTKYLTLALEVRKITDALIQLVEEDQGLPELKLSLDPFLKSLTDQPSVSVKALREMGPFGQYESLRIINEIFQGNKKKELVGKLEAVLNGPAQSREESALTAIRFLDSLERSALYQYENPRPEDRLAFAK